MFNVHESMKKFIEKCDLYFEGSLISKETLLRNYAYFLNNNFGKEHNVAISLHTGSICFDIMTILFTAISNIFYNQENAEEYICSLNIGDLVLYGGKRCKFGGFKTFPGEDFSRVILYSEKQSRGQIEKCTDYVKEAWWNRISPYKGEAETLDSKGIKSDSKKRNDFLTSVFELDIDSIPGFLEKSSVIVMDCDRSRLIINNLEIGYEEKIIKITDVLPVSYCTENKEYQYGANPGKIEPAIKITNSISNARSLVTKTWPGNSSWINEIVGVSIIGFHAISRAKTEVSEIMKRRKLKYVFLSYNISSEEGETLLDEVEDISVFACTTEYLSSLSYEVIESNPFTEELNKQIESTVNHETISIPVKTFNCDWNNYRRVQIALSQIRHSGYKEAEDFVPLAFSVMNLLVTSVFPLQLMEELVEKGLLEVESPMQRIIRLNDMLVFFNGEAKEAAKTVINFLEDGYTKLLTYSPKEQALTNLISNNCDKEIAIIVPKAYYATILNNTGIYDNFQEKNNLHISTANTFDYSKQYDLIITIGAFWGKKFDPFRCKSSSKIYVIVSSVEENIFKYRKRISEKIEQKINIVAKVPINIPESLPDDYFEGVSEEEVSEVVSSTYDVSEYISKIFETKSLEMINTGSGNKDSLTDISFVATCEDGEMVFFTKKYNAYVFDSINEDVVQVPVDKLSPGDVIIFKTNNSETKDIVTTLLDKYIDEFETTSEDIQIAYLKSKYWKIILKEYKQKYNLSLAELSSRLESCGSKKHWVTIQSWLSDDSFVVGPQESEAYQAIAQMTQDPDMMADPESFCIACDKIRRIRIRILKLIAKTIISKYSGKLTTDDDMGKVVSENIDAISTLVQIETITPVEDKKAPINMVNRPIVLN